MAISIPFRAFVSSWWFAPFTTWDLRDELLWQDARSPKIDLLFGESLCRLLIIRVSSVFIRGSFVSVRRSTSSGSGHRCQIVDDYDIYDRNE